MAADPYTRLIELTREAGLLSSVEAVLEWDQETYMPPNGIHTRADQLALMAEISHRRRTDPEIGVRLAELARDAESACGSASPHDAQTRAANVREIRRGYERAVKIPPDLVKRIAATAAVARDEWAKARSESSFARFAPHLAELLELKREVAERLGYAAEPYDALLDEYEPGMTSAEVERVFSALRGPLSAFVRALAASKRPPDGSILHRHFPRAAQEQFGRRLVEAIGFDFKSGRIDVSTHPFCSGTTPGDVRLTTRYQEDFFSPSIFGMLHEAGHGLYEQGLDAAHSFTPMGTAASLGIHESQSRLWENMVGRSRAFWEHFYPECRAAFPEALGDVSLDAFVGAINVVRPSLIRVEADEVTYNLHIILRFELERAMIAGKLAVKDVPEAWNAKMDELLGISPENDREGCLQDIHWSMGGFGYFPTYALGNIYAAQFYSAAERALPDLSGSIRRGEFRPLLDWLRTQIHRHGQRYRASELVARVTGAPPSIEPLMGYLKAKFGAVYGV